MEALKEQEIIFNGQPYTINILISRLKDDGKTPDDKTAVSIPFDFITKLEITSDLFDPCPSMVLQIKDPFGEKVTDFSEDGRSVVYFKCINKSDGAKLEHSFIISTLELLTIDSQQTIIEIAAESIHYPIWLGSLPYSWASSGGGKQKSPTKIIEEILQQAQLPLTTLKAEEHSSLLSQFISPSNSQVGSCVNYLLNAAVSDEDGIFFMTYYMPDNKFKLLSLVALAKKDILPFNATKIPTWAGFAPSTGEYSGNEIARNIITKSYLTSMGIMDINAEMTLNEFSQLTRKWTKDSYTPSRLKRTLSPIKTEDYQKTYLPGVENPFLKDKKVKMKYTLQPKRHITFGGRLREFMRLNSNVRFTVKGYVKRNAGDGFKVVLDGPQTALYKKLAGTYIVSRIVHIFRKDNYDQEIDVVRPDRLTGLDVGVK